MKKFTAPALGFAAIATMASVVANAGVQFNLDVNPFGWGSPPPPVVYQPPAYYAPPPVVYYGHGNWGDRDWHRHEDRGRDHRDHRADHDHHDDHGDHR